MLIWRNVLHDQVAEMRSFFNSVPEQMQAKHFSRQRILAFKKAQAKLETRASRDCERVIPSVQQSLGSGPAIWYWGCYAQYYRPRLVAVQKMLNQSHFVRHRVAQ